MNAPHHSPFSSARKGSPARSGAVAPSTPKSTREHAAGSSSTEQTPSQNTVDTVSSDFRSHRSRRARSASSVLQLLLIVMVAWIVEVINHSTSLVILATLFVAAGAAFWLGRTRGRDHELDSMTDRLAGVAPAGADQATHTVEERSNASQPALVGDTAGQPTEASSGTTLAPAVAAPGPMTSESPPAPNPLPKPTPLPPPATFQIRPLVDPGDEGAHPHQLALPAHRPGFFELRDGWHVLAASRRGRGHEDEGKYREDDVYLKVVGKDLVLAALADGVGSKRLSRHGARAAVLGATDLDEKDLWDFASRVRTATFPADAGVEASVDQQARRIVRDAVARARHAVEARVQEDQRADADVSADDLGSTLLILLAVPHHSGQVLIAGSQIGDGALYSCRYEPTGRVWAAPLPQQIGSADNEVVPFMRATDAEWDKRFFCVSGPLDFVMAMTDGTADDLRPPFAVDGQVPDRFIYIDEFHGHIRQAVTTGTLAPAAALLEFLGYRKKQSVDDRTVVCLYRK